MEYIDIIDNKTGNKTGEQKSHLEVHTKGLWHRTVHVWCVNSKGEILLQRRAINKKNFPDMWDISVAGHISANEDAIEAALRETKEEIGLDILKSDSKFIRTVTQQFILNNGTYLDNEFQDIYIIKIDVDIDKLNLQKEELKALRWIKTTEFKKWVEKKRPDLVPHPEEYKIILEYINKNYSF